MESSKIDSICNMYISYMGNMPSPNQIVRYQICSYTWIIWHAFHNFMRCFLSCRLPIQYQKTFQKSKEIASNENPTSPGDSKGRHFNPNRADLNPCCWCWYYNWSSSWHCYHHHYNLDFHVELDQSLWNLWTTTSLLPTQWLLSWWWRRWWKWKLWWSWGTVASIHKPTWWYPRPPPCHSPTSGQRYDEPFKKIRDSIDFLDDFPFLLQTVSELGNQRIINLDFKRINESWSSRHRCYGAIENLFSEDWICFWDTGKEPVYILLCRCGWAAGSLQV